MEKKRPDHKIKLTQYTQSQSPRMINHSSSIYHELIRLQVFRQK